MSEIHPTPDALAEAGYRVLPLKERQKFLADKNPTWREAVDRGVDFCRARLLSERGRTGAALSPHPDDPVPLFILDIDDHQRRPLSEIWASLCPQGEELPPSAGVCRTVNGGLHLYFQAPPDLPHKQVPRNRVDFGNGLTGDIFQSLGPRSLVVLPGSEVRRKSDGKYGYYEELQPINPQALPYPPDSVVRRILARKAAPAAANKDTLPTEAYHVLDLVARISQGCIAEGEMDVSIAQIGEILGRISPQKKPSEAIVQRIFDSIAPVLQSPPFDPTDPKKQQQVQRAIYSGWKTGQGNKEKYDARDKNPSVSDVLAECEAIFGGWPWIHELRRTGNAGSEIVLGVGGTSKTPHEAFVTGTLESLDDLLPVLTAISGADHDTVACSPFHVQPGWMKTLKFYLQATKAVHYLGDDPEEALVASFRLLARNAADDEQIFPRLGEKRDDSSRAFIHWPTGQDDRATLVIPDSAEQEHILAATGNIRIAQNWVKEKVIVKTIAGRGNKKAWCVPLREFGEESLAHLAAAYEKVLQSRAAEVE